MIDILRQLVESAGDIAHQLDIRGVVALFIGGQHVDVHQRRVAAVPHRRFVFHRAVADADHRVGELQQTVPGTVVKQPNPAGEAREVILIHRSGGLIGAGYWNMAGLQQTAQRGAVFRLAGHQAEQEDRVLRTGDKFRHRSMASSGAAPICGAPLAGSTLPLTGPSTTSCGRLTNALPGRPCSAARKALETTSASASGAVTSTAYLVTGLNIATVSILWWTCFFIGAFYRAASHHRVAFAVRGGHAGDQVRTTRTGGDQRHARFAGNTSDGGGHKCGVGFVAYRNNANRGIQQ